MANVVDFAAFLGGESTPRTPDCRLVLTAERFQSFSGLVISRMVGLRNVNNLEALAPSEGQPWSGTTYRDGDGRTWRELDLGALVEDENFLNVGA